MGTYSLETIIREWAKEKLTAEQVIGQILLLLQEMQKRLSELESQFFKWERANKS
jgi:hypothetical protein